MTCRLRRDVSADHFRRFVQHEIVSARIGVLVSSIQPILFTLMNRRFLFQFSLRSLLLVMLLVGIGGGLWMGQIWPIQSQWRAAGAIFDVGGTVETSPSDFPKWLHWTQPEGQTDNIEVVRIDHKPVSNSSIRALKHFPCLKRLYLERSELQPEHLDQIAKLESIERLSIWGNPDLTNKDIIKLSALKKLKVLDITALPGATWRCVIPFANRPDLEIRHHFDFRLNLQAGEANHLAAVQTFADNATHVTTQNLDEADIPTYLRQMKSLKRLWVHSSKKFDTDLIPKLLQFEPVSDLFIEFAENGRSPTYESIALPSMVQLFCESWEVLGPNSSLIRVIACSDDTTIVHFRVHPDSWSRHLTVNIWFNRPISRFKKKLEELNMLDRLPILELRSRFGNNGSLNGFEALQNKVNPTAVKRS